MMYDVCTVQYQVKARRDGSMEMEDVCLTGGNEAFIRWGGK
jgi:hypothetical protein